ncbi:MAG: DUF433 domain-containing protein [Sphingobacteriales bacterium]
MDIRSIISKNPEVLGGIPVFAGTRVPIETLFDHLESGVPLDEFLDDFPTVTKEQAVALLEIANKILNSKDLEKLYETAA